MKVNSSFQNLPKSEQIRLAMPIARRALIEGIDVAERRDDNIIDLVAQLANDPQLTEEWAAMADETEHSALWNRLEAAPALGIAIGLLVNRDLFLSVES